MPINIAPHILRAGSQFRETVIYFAPYIFFISWNYVVRALWLMPLCMIFAFGLYDFVNLHAVKYTLVLWPATFDSYELIRLEIQIFHPLAVMSRFILWIRSWHTHHRRWGVEVPRLPSSHDEPRGCWVRRQQQAHGWIDHIYMLVYHWYIFFRIAVHAIINTCVFEHRS